jgi:hypothetical protein
VTIINKYFKHREAQVWTSDLFVEISILEAHQHMEADRAVMQAEITAQKKARKG